MLEYPKLAVGALALLMKRYNDIDIYVEDRRYIGVYTTLVRRALGERAKVRMVFSLGGRNQVLTKCKQANWKDGRRQIFIIDGDFDLLLGKNSPRIRGLHRLDVYCIENVLVDLDALLSVAQDAIDTLSPSDVTATLNLGPWLDNMVRALIPLYILYAISEDRKTGIPTSGYSVEQLCKQVQKVPQLCPIKTADRIRQVMNQLEAALGRRVLRQEIRKIEKRIGPLDVGAGRYISGKTYLFPLVAHKLRTLVKSGTDTAMLRTLLAERVNLRAHRKLIGAIRRAGAGAH